MTQEQPKEITEPGIYSITNAEYHADPCRPASLSSSGARQIISECPAKFWWNSPLNPNQPAIESDAFSVGKAAHDWLLEGDRFWEWNAVMPADMDLRSNAGKAFKKECDEAGKNMIRHHQYEAIKAMRDALLEHEWVSAAFQNGQPEQSLFARDPQTGVWLRARPDFLPHDPVFIPDYKTAVSADPAKFERDAAKFGYHQQAAWIAYLVYLVTSQEPKAVYYIVQEKDPPYLVQPIALDEQAVVWGEKLNRKAINTFARCLETGHWPGYADEVATARLPGYVAMDLHAKEEAGYFDENYEEGEAA